MEVKTGREKSDQKRVDEGSERGREREREGEQARSQGRVKERESGGRKGTGGL